MYEDNFLNSENNKNISKIRNLIINNLIIKNNLNTIKNRSKNSRYSLLKENKNIPIKKTNSLNFINISIKKTISVPKFTNKTKSPIKSNDNLKNTNKITFNNNLLSHKIINKNNSNILLNAEKFQKVQQSYKSHLEQAKKRNTINQFYLIEQENKKFGEKLRNIHSPLNKNKFNVSYSKNKEYVKIAKKIDKKEDVSKKRFDYILKNLPPLLSKKTSINFNNSSVNNNSFISDISKVSSHFTKSFNINIKKNINYKN
jgi:hypothetical protein